MQNRLRSYWYKLKFDKPLFWIVVALVVVGLFVFTSGALSVLAKNPAQFYRILLSQLVLGCIGGIIAGYIIFQIPYTFFKTYALYIFIGGLVVTALVFIPGISLSHGGATSWLSLGPVSFQPAEFLKIGFVIYMSAWYSFAVKKIGEYSHGLIPLVIMIGVVGGLLLAQPDTGTFLIIASTGIVMYFVSGARWRDFLILFLIFICASGLLLIVRPYTLTRIKTFLHPAHDLQGASYQVYQASIAIGSGRLLGRGYGQSVQKFSYLPEPMGDAVFAVIAEEVGFVGSVALIILYLLFALRGLYVARRAPNMFARLLVIGLVSLIIIQSLYNMGAIMGVFPLTGLPLIFMSQGGTALMFSLVSIALILHISQYSQRISQA